jgi:hypothetical protein
MVSHARCVGLVSRAAVIIEWNSDGFPLISLDL